MDSLCFDRFFDLKSFGYSFLFESGQPFWSVFERLKRYLDTCSYNGIDCEIPPSVTLKNVSKISIGEGTIVEEGAYIQGPSIIGRDCHVRHGSYIRPYLLTGDRCVIGHATETKCSIFLHDAKAAHFNYIGDSILGNDVNMGAGATCSNVRLDQKEISVRLSEGKFPTGLKKFGALIGDFSQIGCHVVLNPGVLLKKRAKIYLSSSISHSDIGGEVPSV